MWQFDGQWWMTSDHDSRAGASVPSCVSVAPPENWIRSPTFQRMAAAGAAIVAVGGVLSAGTTSDAVSESPWLSVAFRRAVWLPVPYVKLGLAAVESSNAPSLSRSHA